MQWPKFCIILHIIYRIIRAQIKTVGAWGKVLVLSLNPTCIKMPFLVEVIEGETDGWLLMNASAVNFGGSKVATHNVPLPHSYANGRARGDNRTVMTASLRFFVVIVWPSVDSLWSGELWLWTTWWIPGDRSVPKKLTWAWEACPTVCLSGIVNRYANLSASLFRCVNNYWYLVGVRITRPTPWLIILLAFFVVINLYACYN